MAQSTDLIDAAAESATAPKLCKNCANLIGRRDYIEQAEFWRCGALENITSKTVNLVTGADEILYEYENLNVLRTDGDKRCGKAGNWFQLYKRPEYKSMQDFDTLASPDSLAKKETKLTRVGKQLINLADL